MPSARPPCQRVQEASCHPPPTRWRVNGGGGPLIPPAAPWSFYHKDVCPRRPPSRRLPTRLRSLLPSSPHKMTYQWWWWPADSACGAMFFFHHKHATCPTKTPTASLPCQRDQEASSPCTRWRVNGGGGGPLIPPAAPWSFYHKDATCPTRTLAASPPYLRI